MIEGVKIIPLKQILDERGKIMHMLRCDAEHFISFGEIYFSCIYPGVIKGWHLHTKMTLNYTVPFGNIKFVLYDDRSESKSRGEVQEIFMGPDNYCLVVVPSGIWNGFKGIGNTMAIVANCSSIPHDATEIDRKDPFTKDIPYNWDLVHR